MIPVRRRLNHFQSSVIKLFRSHLCCYNSSHMLQYGLHKTSVDVLWFQDASCLMVSYFWYQHIPQIRLKSWGHHRQLFVVLLKPFLDSFCAVWQGSWCCYKRPLPSGTTVAMKERSEFWPNWVNSVLPLCVLTPFYHSKTFSAVCATVALQWDQGLAFRFLHTSVSPGRPWPRHCRSLVVLQLDHFWYQPLHTGNTTPKTCRTVLTLQSPLSKSLRFWHFFFLLFASNTLILPSGCSVPPLDRCSCD